MKVLIKKDYFKKHGKNILRKLGEASIAALMAIAIGESIESVASVNFKCMAYEMNLSKDCPKIHNYSVNYNTIQRQVVAGLERDKTSESALDTLIIDRIIFKNQSLESEYSPGRNTAFNALLVVESEINKLTGGKAIHVDGKKIWDTKDYYLNEIAYRNNKINNLLARHAQGDSPHGQDIKNSINRHFLITSELKQKLYFLEKHKHLLRDNFNSEILLSYSPRLPENHNIPELVFTKKKTKNSKPPSNGL